MVDTSLDLAADSLDRTRSFWDTQYRPCAIFFVSATILMYQLYISIFMYVYQTQLLCYILFVRCLCKLVS